MGGRLSAKIPALADCSFGLGIPRLGAWYLTHLGVGAPEGEFVWNQQSGPTVFSPFKADSDYFAADKALVINLRVSDLDGLLAELRAAGFAAETRAD